MSEAASFEQLVDRVSACRSLVGPSRAVLVGVSGIDASGKGYISAKLAAKLENKGFNVALTNVDGWLNLPKHRFSETDPGRHFYEKALRLDEMFERLILPLKAVRSIDVTADFAEETATDFRPHRYRFADTDVIVLEGIFLFKPQYLRHFDLKIWIDCPFETALTRAVARSQEGLDPAATTRAYQTIYFPAQRLHFERDDPRSAADIVFQNG